MTHPSVRFTVAAALCGAGLSLTLSSPPARADSAAGPIEDMVVTASRIPTRADTVGSTVSTVSRPMIEQREAVHGAAVLQDVPGLAVSRLGGYGAQTQVRVRGAEANQVLVLIDGVKANDPAGSDEFDFSTLTLHDVESLEVVRGPQSALWGSEATAGVINITTRRAEGPLAEGFVEGGSRDTLYTGLRLGTGGRHGGIVLNAAYFDTTGESAAAAGTEDDGYENLTASASGRWLPDSRSRLAFAARYTAAKVAFDGTDFSTGLPADADLVSRNDFLTLMGEGGLTVLDDRWDHSLRLTWLATDREQERDGDWESSTGADKLGVYYQSTLSFAPADQRLVVALDYEDERFEQRGFTVFDDPNQDQKRRKLGWVLEYLATPLAGLDLSASIRFDDNSDFRDVTTYRLTGSYRFADTGTRLHGSYGTGQKAPTFIEQFGYYVDSFIGNPDLKPEQTAGFDLGIEQPFGAGRWRAGLTWFNERLTDEIVTTFDPGSFLATADNLSGRSRREGLEATLAAELTAALTATASYTYVDATQPDGAAEIRRPRHMAAAGAHYRLLSGRAGVNVNLSYSGPQRDTIFPPPTYAQETVLLDDYLLVTLTGRFALTDRLDVYLRADNLLDEAYTEVVGYRAPGRSLHLGLRFGAGR
ncbi:MAG: TonB-dependent receptor plug domain-containing protein [Pseudomonadales bacterium]